jgi:hypothetical protein
MTDWQPYRNGNRREIWNLERLARHRAAKLGYGVHRSRRRKGRDNGGEFMLLHKASSPYQRYRSEELSSLANRTPAMAARFSAICLADCL